MKYRVTVKYKSIEVFEVEANSKLEAEVNWSSGEQISGICAGLTAKAVKVVEAVTA
jgi:hypothetical protein